MKVSDYISTYLANQGVTHVFELVGGMITHLLDSLADEPRIRIVTMAHEQGAAFAAEGFARVAGTPVVTMATSGPGATNLLTGIGSCFFDSVPVIFITGQVNRHEMKRNSGVRQLGFQETDIVAMARPITKAAWLVEDPTLLPEILAEAFRIAADGRPGPVLIDIPMDVQRADINANALPTTEAEDVNFAQAEVEEAWRIISEASRPLLLVGGGVRSSHCIPLLRRIVDIAEIPVVNSLMAVDALPAGHPARVGLIGSYGNRWANIALAESDAVMVLGSRLDIRQTGADVEGFRGGKHIIHIDCDPAEVNNRIKGCKHIHANLDQFLTALERCIGRSQPDTGSRSAWYSHIAALRDRHPDTDELSTCHGINPNVFMRQLSLVASASAGFVVDVGQHQMWAAQSTQVNKDQFFFTSGGMGAMGFALPAAIGAAFATARPVTMIAGDGSMQLNIQELQTVARNRLPLKMIVINNRAHGMVRQFQDSYFNQRYQSTVTGYSAPDFTAVAKAYGIGARSVAASHDVDVALRDIYADPSAPMLLEVMIETATNVYPKIAFGRPISEMEPFAKPIDMEGT